MDLEIEALTSALESLKAISIDSGNKACSFAQSSIISNSSETQSFDNEAEKDMILNGIGELNDFFEEVACSKLRVNANVNALENDGHNESDTTSAEKRYDQEHEQRARTLVIITVVRFICAMFCDDLEVCLCICRLH